MEPLCRALEAARETPSRLAKASALADGLRSVAARYPDDAPRAVALATRLSLGQPLPMSDPRSTGVGYALLAERIAERAGTSVGAVGELTGARGDLGDAAYELLAPKAAAGGLSLLSVGDVLSALASASSRDEKHSLLRRALLEASPLEVKYLVKVLLGELRIGVREGVVEEALAKAFDVPVADIRRASALVTDLGEVAVLALERRLHEAAPAVGRPLSFMLASPLEAVASPLEAAAFVVEDKVDGIRAQLHVQGDAVRLFGRGLEDVTVAFPEVVAAATGLGEALVLDGELLVQTATGRPRPFQALQPRLRKTAPTRALLRDAPVTFLAYDLLVDGEPLLALPWEARRARLAERMAHARAPLALHTATPLEATPPLGEQVDAAYAAARDRGHEGVVLKRRDGPYEAGKRGQIWLKVKRAFASLDVVITRAERGHGKRAGVLSDYTFAVWDGDRLVEIGKAYSGLTDAEIEGLTRRLEELTVEQQGGMRWVRPEIVLEVAFDGIQPSSRHSSGFALRFPRIARLRDDKRPEEADTLAAARALFEAQVATGHREEARGPAQLSLFGDGAEAAEKAPAAARNSRR